MKKLTQLLLTICFIMLGSCSHSLGTEIDNYFKDFAIENYNNNKPNFYRSLQSNESIVFFTYNKGVYTNIISGVSIESNSKLIEHYIGGATQPYFSFQGENKLYDCLGHNIFVDHFPDKFNISTAFISTKNEVYRNVFGDNSTENCIELVELTNIGNLQFVRKYGESFFDFSRPISREQKNAFYYADYNADFYERISKYEYLYSNNGIEYYYYTNEESDSVESAVVSPRDVESNYVRCFDYKFPKFDYFYYVKKIDNITNDFDFYLTDDYIKTFGINLEVGYYKVFSSHNVSYFPLSVRVSACHDYAYSLCLKISGNKTFDPQYYVIKLENKKISSFENDVELFVNNKNYIKLESDYILLDYKDLIYLDGKRSFYIEKSPTGYFHLHFKDIVSYADSSDAYITSISNGYEPTSLFINESNKTILAYSKNNIERVVYDRLFDKSNLLYSVNDKLYFQTFEIGNVSKLSDIKVNSTISLSSCGRSYEVIEYLNSSNSTYYQIVCKGDNCE